MHISGSGDFKRLNELKYNVAHNTQLNSKNRHAGGALIHYLYGAFLFKSVYVVFVGAYTDLDSIQFVEIYFS